MFQRVIDDLKTSTGASLRMTSLIVVAGFAGLVALSFICAAAFIGIMQRYGAIGACLAIAGVFSVIAIIFAAIYAGKKRRARQHAAEMARRAAKAAANSPLIDPVMMATGIQIARAVGRKRLVPLLALAGVVVGFVANRNSASADDGDETEVAGD
ncbi:MAG: hypothetical protein ABWY18_08545 [Tardiphaga sp.]